MSRSLMLEMLLERFEPFANAPDYWTVTETVVCVLTTGSAALGPAVEAVTEKM